MQCRSAAVHAAVRSSPSLSYARDLPRRIARLRPATTPPQPSNEHSRERCLRAEQVALRLVTLRNSNRTGYSRGGSAWRPSSLSATALTMISSHLFSPELMLSSIPAPSHGCLSAIRGNSAAATRPDQNLGLRGGARGIRVLDTFSIPGASTKKTLPFVLRAFV